MKSQSPEAFAGAAADYPYLIAGLDIADHGLDAFFGNRFQLHGTHNVNIIFCVIGKDNRRMCFFPQQPCNDSGGSGTVRMNNIRFEISQLRNRFRVKRKSCPVSACHSACIKAGIRDYLIWIGCIIGAGVFRCADYNLRSMVFCQIIGIVQDNIDYPVNNRREGII